MTENAYNFLKGAKLHLCCSDDFFRPAMNNIFFDEDIEKLNGKLLNGTSYKELLKYPTIRITDTAIEATKALRH